MVSSAASTVDAYLAELPPERREVVAAVRDVVNAHMPDGYHEAMSYGMIGWSVPLARYPNTYHKQPLTYVALAAQKNAYSLYLMAVYQDSAQERALRAAAAAQGMKLDMGKCCVRFNRVDRIPLAAIGELIASLSVDAFIAQHEAARASASRPATATKSAGSTATDAKRAAGKAPPARAAKAAASDKKAIAKKKPAAGTAKAAKTVRPTTKAVRMR